LEILSYSAVLRRALSAQFMSVSSIIKPVIPANAGIPLLR
jgi:hypothetical protein